tara:strand:- start:1970 stop:2479 length:510 start_codon:yes stop_codon:yes gene_type:complete
MIIVLFVASGFLGIIAYNYWQIFRQRREGLNLENDISIPNMPTFNNASFTNRFIHDENLLKERLKIEAIEVIEEKEQANKSKSESVLRGFKRTPDGPRFDFSNPPSVETLKENAKKQKSQYKITDKLKKHANSSKDELKRKKPEITKQSKGLDSAKDSASSGISGFTLP